MTMKVTYKSAKKLAQDDMISDALFTFIDTNSFTFNNSCIKVGDPLGPLARAQNFVGRHFPQQKFDFTGLFFYI